MKEEIIRFIEIQFAHSFLGTNVSQNQGTTLSVGSPQARAQRHLLLPPGLHLLNLSPQLLDSTQATWPPNPVAFPWGPAWYCDHLLLPETLTVLAPWSPPTLRHLQLPDMFAWEMSLGTSTSGPQRRMSSSRGVSVLTPNGPPRPIHQRHHSFPPLSPQAKLHNGWGCLSELIAVHPRAATVLARDRASINPCHSTKGVAS